MQRFLSIALALCVGLTLSLDANAKRFGGGKSSGSAPIHQTRQATPTTPAAAPTAPGRAAPAASGASRWLGPLAGLAAGGLLASMFMGDGFEGFQIMDFLIVALIAFLVFRFIAARRRQQQPQMAMPGHAPMQRETHAQPAQPSIFGGSAAPAAAAAPVDQRPGLVQRAELPGSSPQPLPGAAAALGMPTRWTRSPSSSPRNARVPQA